MVAANYFVEPSQVIEGVVRVPGDKSISHRSIILGSIADGITKVNGFLEGEDTLKTLAAFQNMGVKIAGPNNGGILIEGVGIHGLLKPSEALFMGNSGTAMRLLAGVLAGQKFDSQLYGDDSLSNRPMSRVSEPLSEFGAVIEMENEEYPPLKIFGNQLTGVNYELKIASAQVKSCLLLAAIFAEGKTTISEPAVCRDHTERMLKGFGYRIDQDKIARKVSLEGGGRLTGTAIEVPADISSAAFFIVAAAIARNGKLKLNDVGINPTRTGILSLLDLMGASIVVENKREVGGELIGDILVRPSVLKGIVVPKEIVALAIDEFPVFCIAAACAEGRTILRHAEELRVKESDRIESMAIGLRTLGIKVKTFSDGLEIEGGVIGGGEIDSFSDHRIAMAFAVASLKASQKILIKDCANVATSFPGFVSLANSVGFNITETSNKN